MNKIALAVTASILTVSATPALAAVTLFSNRAAFTTATGANTIETFTPSTGSPFAFPITTGILNSATSGCCLVGTILAGDIKPGVTYSTPIKPGLFFFNIDFGGGFPDGGFLDTVAGPAVLTATFDTLQAGFGFDTTGLMGDFDVSIDSTSGEIFTQHFPAATGYDFFGFASSSNDIKAVRIIGSTSIGFALDNFTYSFNGATVPEPAAWGLMLAGFGLVGGAMRRRQRSVRVTYA